MLPDAITAFNEQRPGIQVQIRQSIPASLMEMLISSELDVYVGPISSIDLESGIEVVHVGSVQSVVYAKDDHPLTAIRTVNYADLLRFKWISLTEDSGSNLPGAWRRKRSRFAYANGLSPPEIAIETTSAINALSLAAKAPHLVCLSRMLLADAKARGLTGPRVEEPLTAYENGIVFRSALGRSTFVPGLVDVIRSIAKDTAH